MYILARSLLLLTLGFTLNIACYAQTKTWTIDALQDSAQQNYPMIKQYDLISKSEAYTLSNANKAFLPQLSITAIGGVIDGMPSFMPGTEAETAFNLIGILQFNQNIWDGGQTKATKQITQAQANIQRAEVEVSMYSIRQRVNDLFFGIMLIDEQHSQLKLLHNNLETNLKRVQAAYKNGTAYQSDLDELKVELLNIEQKLTEMHFAKQAYTQMLSAMVGETIPETAVFEKPKAEPLLTAASEIDRPELKMFSYQRTLFEQQAKLNKSMLYPKLGLMGYGVFIEPGVDFGPSTLNRIVVGGVSLSWNIGGLYRNGNNKNLTAVNLNMVDVQEESFRYATNLQLTKAQKELEKYQLLIDKDKELIQLKKSIKDSYQTKYNNGVSTMSMLLMRINDENHAQQNLVVHEVQYLKALYELKNEMGLP